MRVQCKIFETLEIAEESPNYKESCGIKIVLVLSMSLIIFWQCLHWANFKLIALLVFVNVSGLKKLQTFIIFVTFYSLISCYIELMWLSEMHVYSVIPGLKHNYWTFKINN